MEETTILWVAGAIFAIISALVGTLWAIVWSAIKELRSRLDSTAREISDNLADLNSDLIRELAAVRSEISSRGRDYYEKIDAERRERADKHDNLAERLFKRVEALQDTVNSGFTETKSEIADLRETVAGFGSIYVTRKEWVDGCPKQHLHKGGG